MNNLSNIKTMSSREISEITGKEHRSVCRDIEYLNKSYEKLALHKIVQGYYLHPNTGKQQHRCFELSKMQTFDLLTGYSRELRIKVNRRWAELENKAEKLARNPVKKLSISQKRRIQRTELIESIKGNLLRGDVTNVARDNGFSLETTQNVMRGKTFRPKIVKALFDKAMLRKQELNGEVVQMINQLNQ